MVSPIGAETPHQTAAFEGPLGGKVTQMLTEKQPGRTQGKRRRKEIVAAAAELFDRNGYANTKMEDIANELGLAKPSLYHYFKSKDEILFSIHDEFIELLEHRQIQRDQAQLVPEQKLLELMADILELMETHKAHVRVFFEHFRELPVEQQLSIRQRRDAFEQRVEGVLVEGMELGRFDRMDPRLTALAIFGMCNWAYQWFDAGGVLRGREVAYVFFRCLMHGIAPSTEAARISE